MAGLLQPGDAGSLQAARQLHERSRELGNPTGLDGPRITPVRLLAPFINQYHPHNTMICR